MHNKVGGNAWGDVAMANDASPVVKDPTAIEKHPKIGDKDNRGAEITEVYWATRKFYIYQAGGHIRYGLPEDYDTAATLRQRIFRLTDSRSNIERLRSIDGISKDERERGAVELAAALAQAFETDLKADPAEVAGPLESMKRTEQRLTSLAKSACRKRYVIGAVQAFAVVVVLLFLIVWLLPQANLTPLSSEVLAKYAAYSLFGALGSFLSVLLGLRGLDFDLNLDRWEHLVAGLTRIGIGVFAGIVIGLAINSSFLNPDFTAAGTPSEIVIYFLAFVAGFSESLVPNLLKRGDESAAASSGKSQDIKVEPQGG